ncbi:GNAT family N-acetyltransferase [Paenibacillus protaetiae]|uniref:GNAT family N-acetyltransferase n=1 Tax=Paenibacillus protaetiae TaxID=2509456 RepID=A0A4V0YF05_9BACL|nr:GNAT family N-acetyltransferase [Paenibacillus protaetiae]QAY66031.1 GNAT family N-acetyltransferase [Paenibacillus protaetiae]
MYKKMIVFLDGKPLPVIIRNYTKQDYAGMIALQQESFPPPYPEELLWNEEQLAKHLDHFPAGALCVETEGRIIGSMTGLIVNLDDYGHSHTWETITDNGYIRNHNPEGDTLYVADLCVSPAFRKAGIGKWLMQSMYETVVFLNLKRLLGAGRMPGYHIHAESLTPKQYLEKAVLGELRDPVLTFLLRCGRMPIGVASNYLDDEESLGNAALMEWRNPFLEQPEA